MPDYLRVQQPVFTPTACLGCATHRSDDGWVDLLVELPVHGRAYLCAACVHTAGRQLGMLPLSGVREFERAIDDAHGEILALTEALAEERENKLVSLADVKELVRQRGGRPPTPAAA